MWLLHLNCKFAVVLIGGAVYLLCAADGEDAPANDDLLCAPAAARRESQVRESQVREWFMCFFRCCPAARWCAHVLQYACGDGFINGARDVLQVGGGRLDWVRAAVYDCARFAGVAQLVEQRIRNAKVGSSTLFTGTRFLKRPPLRWPFWSELLKKRNSTNKYHVYIQNHQHIAIINKNQCCDYFHKKQSSIF